ncbi:hypothetical protein GCM10009557_11950 [Virgisporangium ochraceum]
MIIERGTWTHRALVVATGVAVALVLLWMSGLAPFRVNQLTNVFIYAIAITGLNLATGYTGLLSIGHSAFFGLGAYTTGVLVMRYGWDPLYTIGPALVLCFVVGFVIGLPALRIRGLYLALVTLAVGVAFPELVRRFEELTGGARGLVIRRRLLNPPEWTGLRPGQRDLWMFWLSIVVLLLVLLLVHNLVRSRAGLAMRSRHRACRLPVRHVSRRPVTGRLLHPAQVHRVHHRAGHRRRRDPHRTHRRRLRGGVHPVPHREPQPIERQPGAAFGRPLRAGPDPDHLPDARWARRRDQPSRRPDRADPTGRPR